MASADVILCVLRSPRCSTGVVVQHQVAIGLENETVAVPRARAPQLDRNAAREIVDGQVAIL